MPADLPTTRRAALFTGAAAALAAPALIASAPRVLAQPAREGLSMPQFLRFPLGGFEVTTLLSGTRTVPEPHGIFGTNASDEEFAAASAAAFIPTDQAQFFFTPTLVDTGSERILFDTGNSAADITAALEAAGVAPSEISTVVITHMHGDHVGGLAEGTQATFPEARLITGAAEMDHWSEAGGETFEAKVRPFADRFERLEDGGSVASGVTAMLAPGHTPGHMAYMLESGGQQLVLIADTANHYVWSIGHPDWEVRFDMDKARAAQTRKEVLGMIAADRLPFIGYHMPFPALGYLEPQGEGFRYVAASYQHMLPQQG